MKNSRVLLLAALLGGFGPLSSYAFHINEHMAISDRAVFGLQKCGLLPQAWDMNWKEIITQADRAEDLDLVRKIKYAHYYNPNHALDMGDRVDSSVSILESVQEIKDLLPSRKEPEIYKLVGRLVHHIQDSAVPAHAVPVNHLANDGFEKFDMASFFAEPISIEECGTLAAAEPMTILQSSALSTLAAIEQPVNYSNGDQLGTSKWSDAFWNLGVGQAFGKYGTFGDNFGQTSFKIKDGSSISVDPAQYTRFKRAQLMLALRSSQNAILWANRELGL